MNKETFREIEAYMLINMNDSSHDCQHIYRVLYFALDIARNEENIDYNVLITACLLHDIGRASQFKNPTICHAKVGSEMAVKFLLDKGWSTERAIHIRDCIASHRYRSQILPETLEAKILFDSDKLDIIGTVGIARTLLYQGQTSKLLYSVDANGNILTDNNDSTPSFIHEYNYKLRDLYDKFYTVRGKEIAIDRRQSAFEFYKNMLDEIQSNYQLGKEQLGKLLT